MLRKKPTKIVLEGSRDDLFHSPFIVKRVTDEELIDVTAYEIRKPIGRNKPPIFPVFMVTFPSNLQTNTSAGRCETPMDYGRTIEEAEDSAYKLAKERADVDARSFSIPLEDLTRRGKLGLYPPHPHRKL